jgi:hypothetical protein
MANAHATKIASATSLPLKSIAPANRRTTKNAHAEDTVKHDLTSIYISLKNKTIRRRFNRHKITKNTPSQAHRIWQQLVMSSRNTFSLKSYFFDLKPASCHLHEALQRLVKGVKSMQVI